MIVVCVTMITDGLDPVDDMGFINKQKTIWLWKSYDAWVDHVKDLTKEATLVLKRIGPPNVNALVNKKEIYISGSLFDVSLVLDACKRISPTRVELWKTIIRDDVIDAMIESGAAMHDKDYAMEQLVVINDMSECGVIASIFPGSATTKKIQMSKL